MDEFKRYVSEHPYIVGAAVLATGGLIFLLRGGSTSSNTTGLSGSQTASIDLAQIQAGDDQATAAANAQTAAQQISANATAAQVQAQLYAVQSNNSAAVQANQDTVAAQVAAAALTADTTNIQTETQGEVLETLINAGTQQQALTDQIYSQQLSNQASESETILSRKNYGQGENIALATVNGNTGIGETVATSGSATQIAGDAATASIVSGLTKAGTSLLTGLL